MDEKSVVTFVTTLGVHALGLGGFFGFPSGFTTGLASGLGAAAAGGALGRVAAGLEVCGGKPPALRIMFRMISVADFGL